MNSAQITRIFWKEYRTQRSLWLAVMLLFPALAALSLQLLPAQNQPDVNSLFAVGMITVACYMLISTSILYASEREHQAEVFLQTLPTNHWLMLGVKCAWVLFSSLFAVVIFTVVAHLLAAPGTVSVEESGFVIWMFAYVFSCTLVVSLLSRHTVTAIGLSVVVVFAIAILDEYLESTGWLSTRTDRNLTIIILMLLATALELNRRWFRESGWTWRRNLRFGRALTLQSAVALPLEAEGDGRLWRRYLWREWQSLRWWWMGIAVAAFLLTTALYQDNNPTEFRFFLFTITMVIVPLLFGVGSCRADQTKDRYLFLGIRGASSFRLLLAKQIFWIGCGLALVLILQLLLSPDYQSLARNRSDEFSGSLRFIPMTSKMLSTAKVAQLHSSYLPGIQFCAATALLMYAVGHLCSQLFAQPVTSLITGAAGGFFVMCLTIYLYTLDVPLFVLTIAPAICLFALSFRRGNDWITGNRCAASRKQFILWAALGVWTPITLLAAWRVVEIPFSPVVDLTGLVNIPTYYLTGCAIGLTATLFVLVVADGICKNLKDRTGNTVFRARRWCTPGGFVAVFLVGHNLFLAMTLTFYSRHLEHESLPLLSVVSEDIRNYDELSGTPDLYQVADTQIAGQVPLHENKQVRRAAPYAIEPVSQYEQFKAYYAWSSWDDVTAAQRDWLANNQQILPLFFEADQNGFVKSKVFKPIREDVADEVVTLQLRFVPRNQNLILLVRLQALKLEHEGRLEGAWKHHIAVVRYARRFADDNMPAVRAEVLHWLNYCMLNGDLWRWQACREQTPELLAKAAEELHQELTQLSPLADAYRREAGWSLEFLSHLTALQLVVWGGESWPAAMPWERLRLRSMIVESSLIAAALARQIDRGTVEWSDSVSLAPHDRRAAYRFNSTLQRVGTVELVPNQGTAYKPELLRKYARPSTVRDWETYSPRLKVPGDKWETTPIMRMPSTFAYVAWINHDTLAETLLAELEFWDSLSDWLGAGPIYSYRAETGQFPASVNQLSAANGTNQFFAQVLQRMMAVGGPDLSGLRCSARAELLPELRDVLVYQRRLDEHEQDYLWLHPTRWPQPQYNFGDAPDRKPPAPRPEEAPL